MCRVGLGVARPAELFAQRIRAEMAYEPAADRVVHCNELMLPPSDEGIAIQGARCMHCGIPCCRQGCPVSNIIPDFKLAK